MTTDQQPGAEPGGSGAQAPQAEGADAPSGSPVEGAGGPATGATTEGSTVDPGPGASGASGASAPGASGDGGAVAAEPGASSDSGAPEAGGPVMGQPADSAEGTPWAGDPEVGTPDADYVESLEAMPGTAEGAGDTAEGAGGGGAAAAQACLAALAVPAALSTPARDLTRRDARDIVVYLIAQGALTLRQAWTPLQFDGACNVVAPRPDTHVALDPPVIDGVRFTSKLHPANNTLFNLDVRMLVLLYRLAHTLRTTWSVTEIFHLGIGAGNGASNDCHNTGRAMDFAGVAGTISGSSTPALNGPYQIDVLADWGRQPVTMPDGTSRPNWPASFTQTTYRLSQTGPNFLAYAIFQDVYNFATLEAADSSPRPNGNGAATAIGATSRFIIHPDYPSGAAWARPAHQDHIHMQIGPTGEETSPP